MPRFIKTEQVGGGYRVTAPYTYYSSRFQKKKTVPVGFWSDGATFVPDPEKTDAWIMHDVLCFDPCWDDGTPLTNADSSKVLYDVAVRDGYMAFASVAWIATYLFANCGSRAPHGIHDCPRCATKYYRRRTHCPVCELETGGGI